MFFCCFNFGNFCLFFSSFLCKIPHIGIFICFLKNTEVLMLRTRECLRSVVGLVIQATGRTEVEDGLRTGVLLGGCWCPRGGHTYPRINFKPLWVYGWSLVECGCQKDPRSDQIPTCVVPRIGGIKSQLLCGVRIELAVGSIPYPQLIWV